jgi:hypothetical protein
VLQELMAIQSLADLAKVIGTYLLALIVAVGGLALLSYAGGRLFDLLPTRVTRILSNVGYYLVAALLLWFVVGSIIGWFVDLPGARRASREGEPCGLGHRWTRVDPAIDPDLSCEKE